MNMRKLASRILRKAGEKLMQLGTRAWASAQERRVRPWLAINGDATLRVEYDLHAESVVFDVGGFRGDWAAEIFARYACEVHVFEPVPEFAADLRHRFSRNDSVHIYEFGLAGCTRIERIKVAGDASSTAFDTGQNIQLIAYGECVSEILRGRTVDLLKINIEGGEYELLEHILAQGAILNIRDLQVQFHDFPPGAEKRMRCIQNALQATHSPTYQYPFVWENWRRRLPC